MKKSILLIAFFVITFTANVALAAPPSQEAEGEAYIVQADDWLSKIALKYYGDMFAYPTIVAATNAKAAADDSFTSIDNPDLIEIGQKLWIPTPTQTAETAESTAAAGADLPLEQSDIMGIYKGALPAATCCGQDLSLYLNFDNTTQLITDYLNGEAPLVEVGDWKIDDSLVLVTITGQENQAYDNPNLITFGYQDDTLTSIEEEGSGSLGRHFIKFEALAFNQKSLPYDAVTAAQQIQDKGLVGIYKGALPGATCCGLDITLYLGVDNTAKFITNYLNGEAPIVEIGDWAANDEGGLTLTLTGQENQTYESPNIIQLELKDGVLITEVYGPDGLLLRYFDGFVFAILSQLE